MVTKQGNQAFCPKATGNDTVIFSTLVQQLSEEKLSLRETCNIFFLKEKTETTAKFDNEIESIHYRG